MHQSATTKLLLFFIVCGPVLYAQQLTISNFNISESGMVSFSTYIEKDHSDREIYDLTVYSSVDNFTKPIPFQLKGLKTGHIASHTFDANKEIGNYEGPLQLRFDIKASTFPIKPSIAADTKLKRGKIPAISWEDYHKVAPYSVELYQNNQLLQILDERTIGNAISNPLPEDLAKGADYQIRITSNSNAAFNSDLIPVQITSKLGLGIKLLPVAVVGAALPIVLIGGGETPPGGEDGFANPPGEPGN